MAKVLMIKTLRKLITRQQTRRDVELLPKTEVFDEETFSGSLMGVGHFSSAEYDHQYEAECLLNTPYHHPFNVVRNSLYATRKHHTQIYEVTHRMI